MKNRIEIAAADLYVLLQREFRRRQLSECSTCYMQLPFRVDRNEADAPNWEVVFPPGCSFGCRDVMDTVIEEFGRVYNLRLESAS